VFNAETLSSVITEPHRFPGFNLFLYSWLLDHAFLEYIQEGFTELLLHSHHTSLSPGKHNISPRFITNLKPFLLPNVLNL
jgi:hypothetical protein